MSPQLGSDKYKKCKNQSWRQKTKQLWFCWLLCHPTRKQISPILTRVKPNVSKSSLGLLCGIHKLH